MKKQFALSKRSKNIRDLEERIAWLQHLLDDPDSGRFYSSEDLGKIERQLKKLLKSSTGAGDSL